jgi:esterase/lipase
MESFQIDLINKTDFNESLSLFNSFFSDLNDNIDPVCRSIILHHNIRTQKSVILFHGLSSAPCQFLILGKQLFDLGYNVIIPRMPYNGFIDKQTKETNKLTKDILKKYAVNSINIANGLGEKVDVIGLSGGGILAAWLAQFYEINTSIIIAPLFNIKPVPDYLKFALCFISSALTNVFLKKSDKIIRNAPSYIYSQQSLKSVAEFMKIGYEIKNDSNKHKFKSHKLIGLVNESDIAINNDTFIKQLHRWRNLNENVFDFTFSKDLNLPHDLIDPNQKLQKCDVVYKKILEYL